MNHMSKPADRSTDIRRRALPFRRAFRSQQEGKWGYALAWLLGVPIPLLLLIYLLRGCT